MSEYFSLALIAAMFKNLFTGLIVLTTDLIWTFGKGFNFSGHIRLLKSRRKKASSPDECALIDRDLTRLENDYTEAHKAWLAPLAARFPEQFQ